MTDKDKELLEKAKRMHYHEWWKVEDMIEEAETPAAREDLRFLAKYLYHVEEFHSGLL